MRGFKITKKTLTKRILVFFIFVEIVGFLTAISFFIAAVVKGSGGFYLASIGGSIMFAVVGSSLVLMIIGAIITGIERRRSPYSSEAIADEFGYQVKYDGLQNSVSNKTVNKKQVYYCSYCGYGTDSLIGECPECGGPIKEK